MQIERSRAKARIEEALRRSPVVALVGPRQCGKTSLAREFLSATSPSYFDLEDPIDAGRLAQPRLALSDLEGLVVIDEVQRHPELFPVLRYLVDREDNRLRLLVLGSASPELLRQSSESLAGRIEIIELTGFTLDEIGADAVDKHWLRGGFPRSFLARSGADSEAWRRAFLSTFVERDLPSLGIDLPATQMRQFASMLAHYHGQLWNGAEIAASLGRAATTVRRYLDVLIGTFLVRELQPWHENLGKRQVKSRKIYFRDSGILHSLLGITDATSRERHPKLGASWEGYVIEQLVAAHRADEVFFWRTQAGAELDLLLFRDGRRVGVEVKREDAPRLTPSMQHAMTDLRLDELFVAYPGNKRFDLTPKAHVVPAVELIATVQSRPGWPGRYVT